MYRKTYTVSPSKLSIFDVTVHGEAIVGISHNHYGDVRNYNYGDDVEIGGTTFTVGGNWRYKPGSNGNVTEMLAAMESDQPASHLGCSQAA